MTDAVFLGTFSDFKLVKGRGVAVFCIEVPLEQAGNALDLMGGLPLPAETRWVGVARVNGAASSNGRTPDFDSGDAGSTPAAATNETAPTPPRGREDGGVSCAASAPPSSKVRRSINDVPLSNRAGMLINDAMFVRYLKECRGAFWVDSPGQADKWLKEHLGIASKRDLNGETEFGGPADRFLELDALYRSYVGRGEAYRNE